MKTNEVRLQNRKALCLTIPIVMFLAMLVPMRSSAQAHLPSGPFPNTLGVNDHSTSEPLSMLQAMYAIGIRYLRIDLTWSTVEKTAGVYAFTSYDTLVANATTAGLKMQFILDYTNPLYDDDDSPDDSTGDTAFTNYAVAAVAHYQGKGIIWEIYNEPQEFWTPIPTGLYHWTDGAYVAPLYFNLASQVATAIHAAYPKEIVVGPSTANLDYILQPNGTNADLFTDIELEEGLGNDLDAISVHPYRETNYGDVVALTTPETKWVDYNWLQNQIVDFVDNYQGSGGAAMPPIVNTEEGYSSCDYSATCESNETGANGPYTYTVAEQLKAVYEVRSVLVDLAMPPTITQGGNAGAPPVPVALHIIYDWSDDGTDTNNAQDNYGLVKNYSTRSPTLTPLPAYYEIQLLNSQLNGYSFVQRISTGDDSDWILQFSNGVNTKYVCWNSSAYDNPVSNTVTIPTGPNVADVVTSYNGNSAGTPTVQQDYVYQATGDTCEEQQYPQYFAPTPLSATTTTVLSTPSGSAIVGQSVTLTAIVVGTGSPAPTGSVQFSVGSTILGSAPLSNGAATLAITTLPVGNDTVTATYSGDTVYGSSSGMVQIAVTLTPPPQTEVLTTTVFVDGSAAVGYTATVTVTNTGTEAVTDGMLTSATLGSATGSVIPQSLGTIAANGGSATVTVSFPGSAGADGAGVVEKYAGTYKGGTFAGNIRAQLLP